jgi:hypothetical protein
MEETVMLSEREVQMLRQIELGLSTQDPGFAEFMAWESWPNARRGRRLLELIVLLGSVLLATVCMLLAQVGAGLIAALLAVAVFVLRGASIRASLATVWSAGRRKRT